MKVIQNVVERAKAPTPKFFKVLRTVGLVLAGISGSLIAAPLVLPTTVVAVAGYLAVAGGIISAVSQLTVVIDPTENSGPQQVNDPSTPFRVTKEDGLLKEVEDENTG